MYTSYTKKTRVAGIALLIAIVVSAMPSTSIMAQTSGGGGVGGDMVPISTSLDSNSIMAHLKSFTLDGLAWTAAKILVQQITASTVNWINSGFNGSPSFLTNPAGFFLNVGDQITGAFLAKNGGPLSALCSPFSIDVRLALALNLQRSQNYQYACTLGTIIKNSTNAVKNATINGFLAGDFRQGGWPAFVSMHTEDQNNIYGSYLQAQGELSLRIAGAKASVNTDLNRGGGFLSWNKCTDVTDTVQSLQYTGMTPDGVYSLQDTGLSQTELDKLGQSGNQSIQLQNGSLQKTVDSKGNSTFQNCEVETPGSVIGGAINKQLGVPSDTLNLVNSINQLVGALFSQLVTTVLQGGLHTASGSNPGSNSSITSIVNEANGDLLLQEAKDNAISAIDNYSSLVGQYKSMRQSAVDAIIPEVTDFNNIKGCFDTKLAIAVQNQKATSTDMNWAAINIARQAASYFQSEINLVNPIINDIASTTNMVQAKLLIAKSKTGQVDQLRIDVQNATSTTQVQSLTLKIAAAAQQDASIVTTKDISDASADLTDTQMKVNSWQTTAKTLWSQCSSNPYVNYGY